MPAASWVAQCPTNMVKVSKRATISVCMPLQPACGRKGNHQRVHATAKTACAGAAEAAAAALGRARGLRGEVHAGVRQGALHGPAPGRQPGSGAVALPLLPWDRPPGRAFRAGACQSSGSRNGVSSNRCVFLCKINVICCYYSDMCQACLPASVLHTWLLCSVIERGTLHVLGMSPPSCHVADELQTCSANQLILPYGSIWVTCARLLSWY